MSSPPMPHSCRQRKSASVLCRMLWMEAYMAMIFTRGSLAWILSAICASRSAESTKASPCSRNTRSTSGQMRVASSMSASTCSMGQTSDVGEGILHLRRYGLVLDAPDQAVLLKGFQLHGQRRVGHLRHLSEQLVEAQGPVLQIQQYQHRPFARYEALSRGIGAFAEPHLHGRLTRQFEHLQRSCF